MTPERETAAVFSPTPEAGHVRDILETKLYCQFFLAQIPGDKRVLTQYGPTFIRIVWPEKSRTPACYLIEVREKENGPPVLQNKLHPISLEEVIRIVGRYCKKRPIEDRQIKLF